MLRPLALIVSAMLMSRPTMPLREAWRYARVLQEEAVKFSYDPLTAVAIIHFESRWRPGAVSPDGEDFGLGQVRARWFGGCRGDADPVNAPSAGCKAAKAALLVGENNLRRMSVIIAANRELCKDKVGKANLPDWLAGYEGYNSPSRDRWCQPGPKTWQVVDYRKELIAELVHPAPPAKTPPAKAPPAKAPPAKAPAAKAPKHAVAEKQPKGAARR